jgi:hypothetical protein
VVRDPTPHLAPSSLITGFEALARFFPTIGARMIAHNAANRRRRRRAALYQLIRHLRPTRSAGTGYSAAEIASRPRSITGENCRLLCGSLEKKQGAAMAAPIKQPPFMRLTHTSVQDTRTVLGEPSVHAASLEWQLMQCVTNKHRLVDLGYSSESSCASCPRIYLSIYLSNVSRSRSFRNFVFFRLWDSPALRNQ